MTNGVQPGPPGSADKSLSEIVADVSQKLQLLVREEIELAKTEVMVKAKKLGIGAGMAAAAGVTAFYFSIFLFVGIAYLLNDLINAEDPWVGFLIVAAVFLLLTIVLILLGVRLIKKGSPPAPAMAIEEAKATRAAFEEARS